MSTRSMRQRDGGEFAGKVAFVTGSASGIGRATALAFAREGAAVAAADLSEKEGRRSEVVTVASKR